MQCPICSVELLMSGNGVRIGKEIIHRAVFPILSDLFLACTEYIEADAGVTPLCSAVRRIVAMTPRV